MLHEKRSGILQGCSKHIAVHSFVYQYKYAVYFCCMQVLFINPTFQSFITHTNKKQLLLTMAYHLFRARTVITLCYSIWVNAVQKLHPFVFHDYICLMPGISKRKISYEILKLATCWYIEYHCFRSKFPIFQLLDNILANVWFSETSHFI